MKHLSKLLAAVAIATPLLTMNSARAHDVPAAPGASATMEMSRGEIKSIDTAGGKLTIKHGELKNLGMPSMTMVFRVKDGAILGQVKPGDKIDFVAEKVNGALTVTFMEAAR